MTQDQRIEIPPELDGSTILLALHPTGGWVEPLPPALAEITPQTVNAGGSALDTVSSASRSAAVMAFEEARRTGQSNCVIRLAWSDEPMRLTMVDRTEELGVLLAGMVPIAEPDAADPSGCGDEPDPVVFHNTVNATGVFLEVDPAMCRRLGHAPEELTGTSALDQMHPDDRQQAVLAWSELLAEPGGIRRIRARSRHQDGSWVPMIATSTNLLDDPSVGAVETEWVDISEEVRAREALRARDELLLRLADALPTGVLQIGKDRSVEFSNGRWFELTGQPREGTVDGLIACIGELPAVEAAIDAAFDQAVDGEIDITLDGRGTCRHGRLRIRPLLEGADVTGVLLSLEDVTESYRAQQMLAEAARRDPLTGLLNRSGIVDALEEALREHPERVGVLFVDLDNFKAVNDAYDHALGDDVLLAVAEAIRTVVGPRDRAARLGGDEFVIVADVDGRADALGLSDRLRAAIDRTGRPSWPGHLKVAASIGTATPVSGDAPLTLIANADAQMYADKRRRKALA